MWQRASPTMRRRSFSGRSVPHHYRFPHGCFRKVCSHISRFPFGCFREVYSHLSLLTDGCFWKVYSHLSLLTDGCFWKVYSHISRFPDGCFSLSYSHQHGHLSSKMLTSTSEKALQQRRGQDYLERALARLPRQHHQVAL